MAKEVIDGQKIDRKIKLRYPPIEFDKLQMYMGFPYVIDLPSAEGCITISMPTMKTFIELGEKRYLQTINVFTTNTTEYRAPLWDVGIDWNEISDFDLFCMLYKQIDPDISKSIFQDFNFENLDLYKKGDTIVLYDEKNNIEINEEVYQHIAQYLRVIFNINPVEKITKDKFLKEMYINKDKRDAEIRKTKQKESSSIQSLISACVNHPGFKYKLKEVLDMGMYEFYDSVARLNIYENTTAVLKGMYSGFVDSTKFKSNDFNFMREI